jgi:hypothetical protein
LGFRLFSLHFVLVQGLVSPCYFIIIILGLLGILNQQQSGFDF